MDGSGDATIAIAMTVTHRQSQQASSGENRRDGGKKGGMARSGIGIGYVVRFLAEGDRTEKMILNQSSSEGKEAYRIGICILR